VTEGVADTQADLRGIQQVASELGITQRTIRFYEDKGLIEPQRAGNMRVYTKREFARMQVILRGKRLGFSLRDIKAFLDLYDADPNHAEQMHLLADRVTERIATLEDQQHALTQTLAELRTIQKQVTDRLHQIED
jgi:DNA-binding transcriptional MerR regulator